MKTLNKIPQVLLFSLVYCLFSGFGTLAQAATVCGSDVVNDPYVDSAPSIQACIDSTADEVWLVPGTYTIRSPITIINRQNLALKTLGVNSGLPCLLNESSPACAVFQAADDFRGQNILFVENSAGIRFEYIALDGNNLARRARLGKRFTLASVSGEIRGCYSCSFRGFASIQAVVGSGLVFAWGDDVVFDNTLFRDNGRGFNIVKSQQSDGLTLLDSARARVINSYFFNNSDIDLILGNTAGGEVAGNTFVHTYNFSFAALMIDNFNGTQGGDFTGTRLHGNIIDCGPEYNCGVGIDIGPNLFYRPGPITGGEVFGNTVRRARQGIGILGATGTSIYGNVLDDVGGFSIKGKRCITSGIDISSQDSVWVADGQGEMTAGRLERCKAPQLPKLRRY